MKDDILERKTLYVFNKRGGKALKAVDGIIASLGVYAFHNISKGRVGVIVDTDNQIIRVYVGSESFMDRYNVADKVLVYLENFIKDETHVDIKKLTGFCESLITK